MALVLFQIRAYTYLSIVHLSTMYVCCFLNTCLLMMIASPALIYFEHHMIFFVALSLSLSLSLAHFQSILWLWQMQHGQSAHISKGKKKFLLCYYHCFVLFLCFLSSLQKRWVTVAGALSLRHKLKSPLVEVVGVTVASPDPTSRRSTAPWRELYTLREWTRPYWYDNNILRVYHRDSEGFKSNVKNVVLRIWGPDLDIVENL